MKSKSRLELCWVVDQVSKVHVVAKMNAQVIVDFLDPSVLNNDLLANINSSSKLGSVIDLELSSSSECNWLSLDTNGLLGMVIGELQSSPVLGFAQLEVSPQVNHLCQNVSSEEILSLIVSQGSLHAQLLQILKVMFQLISNVIVVLDFQVEGILNFLLILGIPVDSQVQESSHRTQRLSSYLDGLSVFQQISSGGVGALMLEFQVLAILVHSFGLGRQGQFQIIRGEFEDCFVEIPCDLEFHFVCLIVTNHSLDIISQFLFLLLNFFGESIAMLEFHSFSGLAL